MLARALIILLKLYQRTLSRVLGRRCRFEPSCSSYAIACIERRGALGGGLLSIVRLCKCHPFHPGGYDPPPQPPPDVRRRAARHGATRDSTRNGTRCWNVSR
jgi:putative membrane protein insertion efficiency factor